MMRLWLIGVLALLSACSAQQWIEKLSTPEERAFSGQMIDAIQRGDMHRLADAWDPDARPGDQLTPRILAQIRALTPPGPRELATVNVRTIAAGGSANTWKTFNYQVGQGPRWAIVQIILRPQNGKIWLNGLYVQPFDRAPIAAHALTLEGKGPVQYLWLVLMFAALAVTIVAFVLIVRTRGLRRKWLWAVGSLFGFVSFQLNWTTGEWRVWPVSFQLLSTSAFQNGPLMPWVMSFAIPVVAIVFLLRRAFGRGPGETDVYGDSDNAYPEARPLDPA